MAIAKDILGKVKNGIDFYAFGNKFLFAKIDSGDELSMIFDSNEFKYIDPHSSNLISVFKDIDAKLKNPKKKEAASAIVHIVSDFDFPYNNQEADLHFLKDSVVHLHRMLSDEDLPTPTDFIDGFKRLAAPDSSNKRKFHVLGVEEDNSPEPPAKRVRRS